MSDCFQKEIPEVTWLNIFLVYIQTIFQVFSLISVTAAENETIYTDYLNSHSFKNRQTVIMS